MPPFHCIIRKYCHIHKQSAKGKSKYYNTYKKNLWPTNHKIVFIHILFCIFYFSFSIEKKCYYYQDHDQNFKHIFTFLIYYCYWGIK